MSVSQSHLKVTFLLQSKQWNATLNNNDQTFITTVFATLAPWACLHPHLRRPPLSNVGTSWRASGPQSLETQTSHTYHRPQLGRIGKALTWDPSQMVTCHPQKIPKFPFKRDVVQFCPQSLETQTSHTYHCPQQLPAHHPPTLHNNILVFLTNGLHPCYKVVKKLVSRKEKLLVHFHGSSEMIIFINRAKI